MPLRSSSDKERDWQVKAKKNQVQLHFRRAVDTYAKQAVVQHRVADQLLALVRDHARSVPDSVLEIGCCTGILTRKLVAAFPQIETLHLNDLVEQFADHVHSIELNGTLEFLAGDIEELPLPQRYRLIISSSTFHWLYHLPAFFEKLHRHLHPDGLLACTIYGPENLQEVRALTGRGIDYHSLEQVVAMLGRDFEVLTATQSLETLFFAEPEAVLQHLRETGVNALAEPAWTKGSLRHFLDQYQQRYQVAEGVRLSYHPMYLLARPF